MLSVVVAVHVDVDPAATVGLPPLQRLVSFEPPNSTLSGWLIDTVRLPIFSSWAMGNAYPFSAGRASRQRSACTTTTASADASRLVLEVLDRAPGQHRLGRPLDAIALNAGIGAGGAFATDTDLEKELHLIDLNVRSVVHLAKHVLGDMIGRDAGRILFTSSIASTMPGSFQAVYNASKSFVQSFAMALRNELPRQPPAPGQRQGRDAPQDGRAGLREVRGAVLARTAFWLRSSPCVQCRRSSVSISSSARPAPSATQVSGSAATLTGTLVSRSIRSGKPGSRLPPPATRIPR